MRMHTITSQEDAFAAFANLPDAYLVLFDRDGMVLRANPSYWKLLGFPNLPPASANVFDSTHADDAEKERTAFSMLLDGTDTAFVLEKRLIVPDSKAAHYGSTFHVACMVSRFEGPEDPFYLAVLQELKVYRHFRDQE